MKKITLFCLTVLLMMACRGFGQDVDYTVDNAADFSKFKTYKWVSEENPAAIDKLTDEQIKASVDAALAKKGLVKATGDTADLLIGYESKELISEEIPKFPGYGEKLPTIYHGDLAIDMYAPANRHLVWRGVATKTLDPNANAEKRQKNLDKAIAKLMKNYPPQK
jgi:hypothetical protein